MRIIHRDKNFYLSIASILPDGADRDAVADTLCKRVSTLADAVMPGLIAKNAVHGEVTIKPALVTDVALVENPLPTFVSPITKVVNALLSRFTEPPPPDQKLISLAQNLGAGGEMSNARVDALPHGTGLHIIRVSDEQPAGADPAALADDFVKKVRTEAASFKLTVPIRLVDKDVVPIRYNYLAGYLYIFMMVLCGLVLVGFFIMKEKAGIVRKLGAEEAEKEKAMAEAKKKEAAAALSGAPSSGGASTRTYTPGYLFPKLLLAVLGLAAMTLAFDQVWPRLRLVLFTGERSEAVAVSVSASAPGQPDEILKSQAELDAKLKTVANTKDYSWTFYNNLAFETRQGQTIPFQHEVGCKLKPPMPLLDASGLPGTARLLYDPKDPSHLHVLPLEYSTWFLPGLVGLFGLLAFLIGATLAWFARKPIELAPEGTD